VRCEKDKRVRRRISFGGLDYDPWLGPFSAHLRDRPDPTKCESHMVGRQSQRVALKETTSLDACANPNAPDPFHARPLTLRLGAKTETHTTTRVMRDHGDSHANMNHRVAPDH
jgi:hypothetical protein